MRQLARLWPWLTRGELSDGNSVASASAPADSPSDRCPFFGEIHVIVDHIPVAALIETDFRIHERIAPAELGSSRRTTLKTSTDRKRER